MEKTTTISCFISGVRADYKKRKVILTLETFLTEDVPGKLGPILNASRNDIAMQVRFSRDQMELAFNELQSLGAELVPPDSDPTE